MKRISNTWAVVLALAAAFFYALSSPFSKLLLNNAEPTMMAAFLYLGAGTGVGILYLFHVKHEKPTERLTRKDLPYTVGMIVLDIAAPIFLMLGIQHGTASGASLLSNFEIVATALIALLIFKEPVSGRLWIAIGFITLASIVLSFDGSGGPAFSAGSAFVLLAACCWGLENNCTRKISDKSTYEIVLLKGVFSGGGSFLIALLSGEKLPAPFYIAAIMLLGFTAYGLGLFLYIKAQSVLGASKTSAYYAVSPFLGVFLASVINHERLTASFFCALALMLAGTVFVVYDTMVKHHIHGHTHTVVHTHNGITHTHVITHTHDHDHLMHENQHGHRHEEYMQSEAHRLAHIENKK